MKQILVFSLFLLVLSGCKKRWTCACSYNYDFGATTISTKTTEESEKISKKNAQEWCNASEEITEGYTTMCELE